MGEAANTSDLLIIGVLDLKDHRNDRVERGIDLPIQEGEHYLDRVQRNPLYHEVMDILERNFDDSLTDHQKAALAGVARRCLRSYNGDPEDIGDYAVSVIEEPFPEAVFGNEYLVGKSIIDLLKTSERFQDGTKVELEVVTWTNNRTYQLASID